MNAYPEPIPPTEADIARYYARLERAKNRERQRIWALPSYWLLNQRGETPHATKE